MSRIVLASAEAQQEARIREAFGGTLDGHLRRWFDDMDNGDPSQLVADLTHDGPDVVAFGSDVTLEAALRLARVIDRERPEITVMLMTKPTQKLWEHAMKAGVEVVLPPDAGLDEVRDEFERALEAGERRRENLVSDGVAMTSQHRVITVTAPKGGAGKSVIATNLAAGLASVEPGRVVIVDLDLQFGDVAGGLQLSPEKTIAGAARTPSMDVTSLKAFLTPHPMDLYALCAPNSPAEADDVSADSVASIVRLLSEEFRYVVVDTPAGLGEHSLAVFDVTTDFVLVGNMDVPTVRALRKELDVLDELGLVRAPRHFVLSRSDSRVGLDQRDVEATVGMKVGVAIPSSRSVPLAFNQGVPLVTSDPKSPVSRALMELVRRFVDVPAVPRSSAAWRSKRRNES